MKKLISKIFKIKILKSATREDLVQEVAINTVDTLVSSYLNGEKLDEVELVFILNYLNDSFLNLFLARKKETEEKLERIITALEELKH